MARWWWAQCGTSTSLGRGRDPASPPEDVLGPHLGVSPPLLPPNDTGTIRLRAHTISLPSSSSLCELIWPQCALVIINNLCLPLSTKLSIISFAYNKRGAHYSCQLLIVNTMWACVCVGCILGEEWSTLVRNKNMQREW